MTQAAHTSADAVLERIQTPEFRALLEGSSAPADDFSLLALSDLASDTHHVMGEALAGPAVEDVAKDVFSEAAGHYLEQLRNAAAADDELLFGVQIAGQLVLLLNVGEAHAIAVHVGSRTDIAQLAEMNRKIHQHLCSADAKALLDDFDAVQWVLKMHRDTGAVLESLSRPNAPHKVQAHLGQVLQHDLPGLFVSLLGAQGSDSVDRSLLQAAIIKVGGRFLELRRVPFVPRLVTSLEAKGSGSGHPLWQTVDRAAEDILRDVIALILESGLETQILPFPQTDVEFEGIQRQLRALPQNDLDQRLILGGFANHQVEGPDGAMRCRECIYFLPHRRWCDLPELPVPVEADWYCRLWKL